MSENNNSPVRIDDLYPNLSSLVQQCNRSHKLEELARRAQPKENVFFGLDDCCNEVLNGVKRVPPPRCDSYSYLATIDEFVKGLGDDVLKRKKLWNKIKDAKSFLNTVVEAAWAIHFWNSGLSPLIEEPLDPSHQEVKDADIVVVFESRKYWLDAVNVEFQLPSICSSTMREDLPEKLVGAARKKYKDKFGQAMSSGALSGSSVGVLLSVLKREAEVKPFSWQIESSLPTKLFEDTPGLDVVLIHTLRSEKNSDVLKPCLLMKNLVPDNSHNTKFVQSIS